MLDRRTFCLASTAMTLIPGRAVAAPAAAELTAAFDRFFATALDDSPALVTSLGLDKGVRAAAKSRLDDGSLAAVARRKATTARQLATLRAIDRASWGPARRSTATRFSTASPSPTTPTAASPMAPRAAARPM